MKNYQTYSLNETFYLNQVDHPLKHKLSDVIEERIETIWEKEKREFGDWRFNGKLLSFVRARQENNQVTVIEVCEIDYKWRVAQLRDPALKSFLNISPIGISGALWAEGQLLIGLRADHVLDYPSCWEGVPAGGLHTLDYKQNLRQEFEEELGWNFEIVKTVQPLCLIHDQQGGIWDIVLELHLREKLENWQAGEYKSFQWVTLEESVSLRVNDLNWVPSTCAIFDWYACNKP